MNRSFAVAITMGDPAGIGPEVVGKALAKQPKRQHIHYLVVADRTTWSTQIAPHLDQHRADIQHIALDTPGRTPHKPSKPFTPRQSGKLALLALLKAAELIETGIAHALVTAPVSKSRIAHTDPAFIDQTTWLTKRFDAQSTGMMLFAPGLCVMLATIHVPLATVASCITRSLILEKLELCTRGLHEYFGRSSARIAVCGLNPHAGENGKMGDEEKLHIAPAIAQFNRRRAAKAYGPFPADTFFATEAHRYDAVLCMYHDQGLVAIKSVAFDKTVNMTIGLPFVRTSPDHGTAFDIAQKNIANPTSMCYALKAACAVSKRLDTRKDKQ